MKQALVKLLVILGILFVAGGIGAVCIGLETLGQIFVHIFPFIAETFAQDLKEYLSSAYFIVGAIITIASSFGVVISVKERKILYAIISGFINLISIISIVSNLVSCA